LTDREGPFVLHPIGWVESSLTDRRLAPRQGHEGASEACLVFGQEVAEGLRDLRPGDEVIVLTWLDRARRDVLVIRPRDYPARPPAGVFSTRSPERPNPVGLQRVEIVSVDGNRIRVRSLEALDGTPIVDVKPVIDAHAER
jgi:tRNA-Thr(GGU) m(6)t(6)A37 methyltransferase TsaA